MVAANSTAPVYSSAFQSELIDVCKMLSDANRLRIVFLLLQNSELNVTELCSQLDQSQPAVSHHLALLKTARMLSVRRDGKHNFYSICRERFNTVMMQLFDTLNPDAAVSGADTSDSAVAVSSMLLSTGGASSRTAPGSEDVESENQAEGIVAALAG